MSSLSCRRLLQQRGNSSRIQHYQGFKDGKRVYLYHKVGAMEVNDGSKNMEVNTACNCSVSRLEWTGGDLNPRPPECKSGVHTNWTTGPSPLALLNTNVKKFRAFGLTLSRAELKHSTRNPCRVSGANWTKHKLNCVHCKKEKRNKDVF